VLVPYSTCHVVAVPFGLTVPETVAVVGPTAVTGPVLTLGAVAAIAGTAAARAITPAATKEWTIRDKVRGIVAPRLAFRPRDAGNLR
jgi:hypothetical protein